MARLKNEICLICGCTPCTCDAKPKKAAIRKPKAEPKPKAESTPASPRKFKTTGISNTPPPSRFTGKVHVEERDLDLESALMAVRDLASPRDRGRIDRALERHLPQDVDRRFSEWKARHGKA